MGLGVALLMTAIGMAAVSTGTNLLYLMVSTLLSFWLATLLLSWINMTGIVARRKLSSEIFAGAATEMQVELSNRKRWMASYGLSVAEGEADTPLPRYSAFFSAIPPRRASRQNVEVQFPRRGWVEFRSLHCRSGFPFGFLDRTVRWDVPDKALIYPRLLPVQPLLKRFDPQLGELESPLKGHGGSLYAIRDYVPGDPARMIHWKLSAKGTGIKLREDEREEARRLRIVFAPRVASNPTTDELEAFENGVSVAASLAKYFIEAGYEVALWTPAGAIGPGSGDDQLKRLLRALALVETAAFQKPFSRPPSLFGAGADLLVGSDPQSRGIANLATSARADQIPLAPLPRFR